MSTSVGIAADAAAAGTGEARLLQIDGLRALAALSVVAYHYTTRYDELFLHSAPTGAAFPYGFLGVYLFFAISGFVIYMTLDRVQAPLDFVVSRFTRLYPAYWAAVALTWTIVMLKQPEQALSWKAALVNLSMLQYFVHVSNVDEVYWSLQVELVFYTWMLAAWAAGLLRRPVVVCTLWNLLALGAALADRTGTLRVPDTVRYFLLLDYIAWFGLGIAAYLSAKERRFTPGHAAILASSLTVIFAQARLDHAVAGVVTAALVFAASRRRLRWLEARPVVFFGLISYPLYLVHEKIGWLVISSLEAASAHPWAAIAAAAAASTALAYALHVLVEKPASRRLREAYRASALRERRDPSHRLLWAAGALAAILCTAVVFRTTAPSRSGQQPALDLNPAPSDARACAAAPDARRRLVIVLGQSNAASHASGRDHHAIEVLAGGRCVAAPDPLPNTTGPGASLWTALDRLASAAGHGRVVYAPLAVASTRIGHWLTPGELRERLAALLAQARASGLPVAAVLWQQGEADAATPALAYREGLLELRGILDRAGIEAPLIVAKSTSCRGRRSEAVRAAIDAAVAADDRIWAGPDTDLLGAPLRTANGCHFNAEGREAAARAWLPHLARALGPR